MMNPFVLRKKHENEEGRMKMVNEMVFEKVEKKIDFVWERKFLRNEKSFYQIEGKAWLTNNSTLLTY